MSAGPGSGTWPATRLLDRVDALAGDAAADQRPATRPLEVGAGLLHGRLQARFGSCAVHGLTADAPRLPFPDAAFDLVVCVDLLAHLPDPAAGLRELARVSSRHLVLSAPHEPSSRVPGLVQPVGGAGPVQRWTGAGFQRFVSTVANVRAVRSPYPWTVVWATSASLQGDGARPR